jgi:hypothetical protein
MANDEIERLREAANERTGLVAVTVIRPFMPYGKDQVIGLPPEVAWSHINLGNVEEYSGPEESDDLMVGMTGPEPGSGAAPNVPGQKIATRLTRYDRRPEVSPKAQIAPRLEVDPALQEIQPAEIPENWQDFDGAQLRRLAADLSGRRYQELSVDDAEKIIQANIDGTQEDEPAMNTPSGTVFGAEGFSGVVSTRSMAGAEGSETDRQPRARSGGAKKRSSKKGGSKRSRRAPPPPAPGEEE